jgi:hypothetical protein
VYEGAVQYVTGLEQVHTLSSPSGLLFFLLVTDFSCSFLNRPKYVVSMGCTVGFRDSQTFDREVGFGCCYW